MRYQDEELGFTFHSILTKKAPGKFPVISLTKCGKLIYHPSSMSFGILADGIIGTHKLAVIEDPEFKAGDRVFVWDKEIREIAK